MKGVVLTGETVVRTIMKQDYFLKHDSLPKEKIWNFKDAS